MQPEASLAVLGASLSEQAEATANATSATTAHRSKANEASEKRDLDGIPIIPRISPSWFGASSVCARQRLFLDFNDVTVTIEA